MQPLYLQDPYLREFAATVKEVNSGKFIVLDRTAFYPSSGGQPHDTGYIVRQSDNQEFSVLYTGKFSGQVSHEVSMEGLNPGDSVACRLDWDRRHVLMRMHTAAHVLSAVIFNSTGALITGNQLSPDKSRIDFSLEEFDRSALGGWVEEANSLVRKDLPVLVSELPREEAEREPGLARLSKGLPPAIRTIRIVEISGLDRQADGGTHVKSLAEIGTIKFLGAENKGKARRRIYFTLGHHE